ncbi:hypothetical protein BGZ70_003450 [Mortierella alpina]|uniref:Uncharacterized protein n=1 Tax=Mortierella alpina TaxID=64518 RepID=A0A9P6ISF6_MORAP|nr:hypothetical protein BGZ70_003450 [Mortierella alpina]
MLRTTTTTALRTFKPAQVSAVRAYSGKALSDKETAEENRYAHAREQEQIKQLKEALAKKEKEIEELKKAKK